MIYGTNEAVSVESQHGTLFRPPGVLSSEPSSASQPSKSEEPSATIDAKAKPAHTTSTNIPSANVTLPRSLVQNQSIARVLYAAGLVGSRSEGHRLAGNRGAYIGSRPAAKGGMGEGLDFTPVMNWVPEDTEKYIIDNNLLILRVGKWKVKVVKIVSDEEFEDLGLDAPGWAEWKEGKREFEEEAEVKKREEVKKAMDEQAQRRLRISRMEQGTVRNRLRGSSDLDRTHTGRRRGKRVVDFLEEFETMDADKKQAVKEKEVGQGKE